MCEAIPNLIQKYSGGSDDCFFLPKQPTKVFSKKGFLSNFTKFCEFYEISKNAFSTEHLQKTASVSCLTLYLDHEKSGKSTTGFNLEFIKVNKDFCGKLCTSVLFNDVTFLAVIFLIVD